MIRCAHCDVESPPEAKFCIGCGNSLTDSCSVCGKEVSANMAFCPYCGSRLEGAVSARANHMPESTTSDESRVQLATVLFGDVKGFTAMSEDLPPEEVTIIMNDCFEVLSQPILRYDGTIDKYVGDAIMARFGAPKAHEDDPVRAVHAALEMQQALTKFAAELRAARGFELAMRIGINTGQVLAGEVGAQGYKQFTLMGNTVNLASRLEHEAEPGKVLVGESTHRLAKHAFEFEARPPLDIRGQSEPIYSFVPVRPRVGVTSSRSERTGRRLKLVGRATQLAELDADLIDARQGQGRLVALSGEPGVGKSRLVEEFWRKHEHEGLIRVYASAPSFGESMPYSMLGSFVRGLLFGEAGRQDISSHDLAAQLQPLLSTQALPDAVALLDDFLGIEGAEGTEVANMEARSRQAILTDTVKQLLAARSRSSPLLLILEDMHWIDSASLAVLDKILTSIQGLRILALLTYRPQLSDERLRAFSRWAGQPFYRLRPVMDLSPQQVQVLLSDFFDSHQIPDAVRDRVLEKGGGNPFFLEQILNTLVDSGAVAKREGTWIVTGDMDTLSVPDTIQEVLLARIDQLPRGARHVLEVAAVIGRVFAKLLLQAVVEARRELDDQLEQLKDQQMIRELLEAGQSETVEYMFTNSLTQDVAYHGLPETRRRTLHERVAQAIESLGLSAGQVPLLAVHYGKTGNREKALESALAAGERFRDLYANDDAVKSYEQALTLLDQTDNGDSMTKLMVLEALGDLYQLLAESDPARDMYTRAQSEQMSASDHARLWRKLGDLWASHGRYADATPCYQHAQLALREAVDPLEEVSVWVEQVLVWVAQARMDRSRGAFEEASAKLLAALKLASRVDDGTRASLFFERGEIDREQGNLQSASNFLQAASATWEDMGALEKQALVSNALAEVSFHHGELDEAMRYFQRASDIQRRVLDRNGMATTLAGMGRNFLATGDLDAAADRYNQAMTMAEEIDNRSLIATCLLQLGTIQLERGNVPQAEEYVAEARAGFKKMRNWRGSAYTLLVRARLSRARGDVPHARRRLESASNLADEMNDPWLQAQLCVAEAELEEEAGVLQRAAELSEMGISRARALSDPRLVARAERILGRTRARQGNRVEALALLSGSAEALHRMGAHVESARAALDYAIAAQGNAAPGQPSPGEMMRYALSTFQRCKAARELKVAQSVAQKLGFDRPVAVTSKQ